MKVQFGGQFLIPQTRQYPVMNDNNTIINDPVLLNPRVTRENLMSDYFELLGEDVPIDQIQPGQISVISNNHDLPEKPPVEGYTVTVDDSDDSKLVAVLKALKIETWTYKTLERAMTDLNAATQED